MTSRVHLGNFKSWLLRTIHKVSFSLASLPPYRLNNKNLFLSLSCSHRTQLWPERQERGAHKENLGAGLSHFLSWNTHVDLMLEAAAIIPGEDQENYQVWPRALPLCNRWSKVQNHLPLDFIFCWKKKKSYLLRPLSIGFLVLITKFIITDREQEIT